MLIQFWAPYRSISLTSIPPSRTGQERSNRTVTKCHSTMGCCPVPGAEWSSGTNILPSTCLTRLWEITIFFRYKSWFVYKLNVPFSTAMWKNVNDDWKSIVYLNLIDPFFDDLNTSNWFLGMPRICEPGHLYISTISKGKTHQAPPTSTFYEYGSKIVIPQNGWLWLA